MRHDQNLNQIFDQLLLEIETANFDDSILLLVGVLDGALFAGMEAAALKMSLTAHPIAEALGIGKISGKQRGLLKALDRLSYSRALAARMQMTSDVLERAWISGKRIGVLDRAGLAAAENLKDRDQSNIHVLDGLVGSDEVPGVFRSADHPVPEIQFDHIVATGIADDTACEQFTEIVKMAAKGLAPGGSLYVSSFVPAHVGIGWRTVCSDSEAYCYSEQDLARIADLAGLSNSQFQDASGSLIWSEMRHRGQSNQKEGEIS